MKPVENVKVDRPVNFIKVSAKARLIIDAVFSGAEQDEKVFNRRTIEVVMESAIQLAMISHVPGFLIPDEG